MHPEMEVLYHISVHIFWGYSLKFRPKKYAKNKYMVGSSNQSVPESWPLNIWGIVVNPSIREFPSRDG
jgi:hypothetical protein